MDERTHSFGYWLRRRRKALDLTQEMLARGVSCSRFAIRKIEADERRPSRRLAERLADRLAIAAHERPAFLEAARAQRPVQALRLEARPVSAPRGEQAEATPFVGRTAEYERLASLLAAEAGGHVVLIEGEPGIGKSRLLREVARLARAHGLCTLTTRCYEIERAIAYQPVIDLATQAVAVAPNAALQTLAPVALAEIAALVPELAQRVAVRALSGDFPEARQARLLRALAEFFEAIAADRRLVVMVDDLQWADDASVQFLHYFARAARSRSLLLCAYRDEDVAVDERLAGLVRSVLGQAHAQHVRLARLRLADTEALLNGDTRLAARLQRETDGNPLFLTSLLQALGAGEISDGLPDVLPLPEALRNAVRGRLAQLPDLARAVLDVAAVFGRRFDLDALRAVTNESEDQLLRGLETLVRRRLLREEAGGYYDFSHDKLREVVYQDIGTARHIRLHAAVARSLEQRSDDDPHERDARLAEHYERGQLWNDALGAMWRAAERSQRLFALRDALHWLDRAVRLGEAHGQSLQGERLGDLYAQRGGVRALAGQTAGAVEDMRRVIAAAQVDNDRVKACAALIQLGMIYRRADDYHAAMRCLTDALAQCRALKDEKSAANTLYHLGTVAWSNCRNRDAIAYHDEAVAICERLGLTDLVAVQAYHGRGEAQFADLQPRVAIACYERSIELAQGLGDKSYESENLMMIGYACLGSLGLGDYETARLKFDAALQIAQRADLQWHLGPILLGRDHVRARLGNCHEALDGMIRTRQWLEGVGQIRYQLMASAFIGQLLIELGRNEEAVECADSALVLASASGIDFWRSRIMANRTIARVRLGCLDDSALIEREMAQCREHREGYQLTRCLEAGAQLALARGEASRCGAFARELLALADGGGLKELAGIGRRYCSAARRL